MVRAYIYNNIIIFLSREKLYLFIVRNLFMKKIFKEFKEFISRGSVVDLAVGVIIGSAFTAIVNALVNSIFMPLIGAFTGGNLDNIVTFLWTTKVSPDQANPGDKAVLFNGVYYDKLAYIDWGAFIGAVINFLLIAAILFTIVKILNSIRAKAKNVEERIKEKRAGSEGGAPVDIEPEPEPEPEKKNETVLLLEEIRDLLKQKDKNEN